MFWFVLGDTHAKRTESDLHCSSRCSVAFRFCIVNNGGKIRKFRFIQEINFDLFDDMFLVIRAGQFPRSETYEVDVLY